MRHRCRVPVRPLLPTLVIALLLVTAGCATRIPDRSAEILAGPVDLARYAGLWYQVGRYPNFFQTADCAESTAEYVLRPDGSVTVLNRCWKDRYGGTYTQQVRAVGRPMNDDGSWLRVVFYGLFPAGYLITELDSEAYRWAAVTTPSQSHLWILSRTPALPEEQYAAILAALADKGFDQEKIIRTSRQGGQP